VVGGPEGPESSPPRTLRQSLKSLLAPAVPPFLDAAERAGSRTIRNTLIAEHFDSYRNQSNAFPCDLVLQERYLLLVCKCYFVFGVAAMAARSLGPIVLYIEY
jgi:hypothetical protein